VTQALAAWLHLQSMGYAPDQIFLGGDSFGSHLSLALERYLRLEMPALHGEGHSQKPLGMILLSVSALKSTDEAVLTARAAVGVGSGPALALARGQHQVRHHHALVPDLGPRRHACWAEAQAPQRHPRQP
jgi:hypothetical protein